jgi:hypothetical protein
MAASVRWSTPAARVAQQLHSYRPIGFAVRHRQLLRWRQIDFALTPLVELTPMDEEFAPFAEHDRTREWLVWQSATGSAVTTALPCDAAGLCRRLALSDADPQQAAAIAAITELVEAAYQQGGLL